MRGGPFWTEVDHERATQVAAQYEGYRRTWSADADTTGEWKDGSWVLDFVAAHKNHAEYSGAELYAWQFLGLDDYRSASDMFYLAASIRRENSNFVTDGDRAHREAELTCLRMARYAEALAVAVAQEAGTIWPDPEDFGVDERRVSQRAANRLRQAANALRRAGEHDMADNFRIAAQAIEDNAR